MKKKGFTLIELLAVIIVLAVIALIATPVVLNIVEKAKKSATELSAYGYIHAFSNYVVTQEIYSDRIKLSNNTIYQVEDETEYKFDELDFIKENPEFNSVPSDIKLKDIILVSGTKPSDGYIILGKGNLIEAELVIDEYIVYCDY